jgi:hypothetical protein
MSIWDQLFDVIINLSWFLTLASSFTKNDILGDSSLDHFAYVTLNSHYTRLLGMLEIETMPLCYFSIDCLLDPGD